MNIFWVWASACLIIVAAGGAVTLIGRTAHKSKWVEVGFYLGAAGVFGGTISLTCALLELNHTSELKATITERAKVATALAECEKHWIEVAGTPAGRWLLQREHRGSESLAETAKALCTPEDS